jgi:6-pyruvoyltetrahydropterin/6-carboxytetrahydropterin synthase
MRTTISKQFRWEMGHRLPFHEGLCKNVHGHSYEAHVILSGETDANGMVMDYYDMKNLIMPTIDALDHAFLCDRSDALMVDFLTESGLKAYYVDMPTTAENIAAMLLDDVISRLPSNHRIDNVRVRVFETEKTFAEVERSI